MLAFFILLEYNNLYLIIKRENIMKKKNLFVLSIDLSLVVITVVLFAFTNQLLILGIMSIVMFIVGTPYICARKNYLKGN